MRPAAWRQHTLVCLAYFCLAVVQTWPLARHLDTRLTGSPTGDAGVYVWNLWVFSHQIFAAGATPLGTTRIFALSGGPADLTLHNYTVFSDLLAMPLLPWLGVVATFNVVYLVNAALAGYGAFLLARRLTGRVAESFLAGLMFAWSPYLVTRGLGHFSLAAAAPLPLFVLALYRTWDSRRFRDAALAGVALAWAGFSDPYYAIYAAMLGAAFLGSRLLAVSVVRRRVSARQAVRHLLDGAIALLILLVIGVHVLAGGQLRLGAVHVSMHSLYTPMLILVALAVVRLAVSLELRLSAVPVPSGRFVVLATGACALVAGTLLAPTLYAIGRQALQGDMARVPVLWRSSAPGVDLLAFLAPNPNHPLAPSALAESMATGPGGYLDQVASVSWVGLAVMIAAWRLAGFRPPRFWLVVTIGFALLALGPFIQVAGLNTQIPGPWALLRYAPVIGSARMPARFVAVVTLGFAVLLACALAALTSRFPARRTALLAGLGLLLGTELLAAPRPLHDATMPSVFSIVAADRRPVSLLELPTGVRDGLSSFGDFSARAQFNQTFHGKALIGGYLSRVPPSVKDRYLRTPVTAALMDLGDDRPLDPVLRDRAMQGARDFLRATDLGYVVMDQSRVSNGLRAFAVALFDLRKIADADGYELYVPGPARQETER